MKSITGTLYFSDNAPHVIGMLIVDGEHFELAGVRRSKVRTDFTAHKTGKQGDLFDEKPGAAGERKCDLV
jgi:hypothetical protein